MLAGQATRISIGEQVGRPGELGRAGSGGGGACCVRRAYDTRIGQLLRRRKRNSPYARGALSAFPARRAEFGVSQGQSGRAPPPPFGARRFAVRPRFPPSVVRRRTTRYVDSSKSTITTASWPSSVDTSVIGDRRVAAKTARSHSRSLRQKNASNRK